MDLTSSPQASSGQEKSKNVKTQPERKSSEKIESTESASAPAPAPQSEAKDEKKKSKWWIWLLGCCGGLIVLIIVLLVVGYFTIGKKAIEEFKKLSSEESLEYKFDEEKWKEMLEKFEDKDYNYEYQEDKSDFDDKAETATNSPKDVVKEYMDYTLGALPTADVDYDEAKKLLTLQYKKEFTDATFVPASYCIQDGPSKVKISDVDMSDDYATVRVKAEYGIEYINMWDFELELVGNEWKIDYINCLQN